jgi:hypothetical protein
MYTAVVDYTVPYYSDNKKLDIVLGDGDFAVSLNGKIKGSFFGFYCLLFYFSYINKSNDRFSIVFSARDFVFYL